MNFRDYVPNISSFLIKKKEKQSPSFRFPLSGLYFFG